MKRKQRKNIGYKITRKIGGVIRDKTFKNPFDKVGKLPAYFYQKAMKPIIYGAAFKTNGALGYKRGSAPAKGSIRYTFFYIVYGLMIFALFSILIKVVFK